MKCNKCGVDFETYQCGNIKINYCKKCKSVWIKYPMLKKLSESLDLKTPILNPVEMDAVRVKEEATPCPECGGKTDKVYLGVILDKCTLCNGILFDNGELAKFFKSYMKQDPGVIGNIEFLQKYCSNSRVLAKSNYIPEIEIQSKETEKPVISVNGFFMIFILFVVLLFSGLFLLIDALSALSCIGVFLFAIMLPGFKLLKPQEAMVLTVFGKYIGTLKGAGFYYVNPFARSATAMMSPISLKARTLDNGKQKINDEMGNPIEVGIIVIWEVQDTAKAIFNVEDYKSFLSSQSDSALRNIVRMYPYDAQEESGITSLRGDSREISQKLKEEIQHNVKVAGLNIIDAKITHLAYAPEIAAAMLQRQQAFAIIDAKKAIVEGAVGMVEMALTKLKDNNDISMSNSEKVKMINDLLVILCSGKEAQPVVKSGV